MSNPSRVVLGIAALALALASHAAGQQASYKEVAHILPPDVEADLHFGDSVDLSGDTLAVGAPGWGLDQYSSGAVYIFERDPGDRTQWNPTARINNPFPGTNDDFGRYLALDGDTLVVSMNPYELNHVIVVFFHRDPADPAVWRPGSWFSGGVKPDYGYPLAIDEPLAIAGNPSYDGEAYVYVQDPEDPAVWSWEATLTSSIPESSARFGYSVDIEGSRAVIGTPGPIDIWSHRPPEADVFERDGEGTWSHLDRLQPDSVEVNSRMRVAISGGVALVGIPEERDSGEVAVFEPEEGDPGSWLETTRLFAPDHPAFIDLGAAVALDGDVVAIGAPNSDWQYGRSAVYVGRRDPALPGTWHRIAKLDHPVRLDLPDHLRSEALGCDVDVEGTELVAGAWAYSEVGRGQWGSVYVYEQIEVDPALAVTGTCPGEITLTLSGFTPKGGVTLYGAAEVGSDRVPEGYCVGQPLGLDQPKALVQLRLGAADGGSTVRTVAAGACGKVMQAVDETSCAMTAVARIP